MRQRREKEEKIKEKMKQQISSRSKSCPSFQKWKDDKDSEIQQKIKSQRYTKIKLVRPNEPLRLSC